MQIKFSNVSFSYNANTEFAVKALNNISFDLTNDHFVALTGKTGSGKSTIAELINCFIKPTLGTVEINGFINNQNKLKYKEVNKLRKDIGFLFQFSEKQLFEETVLKDILFGVNNFYPKRENNLQLAKSALRLVGLDESFDNRSPFDLSGGEKKRVAIAGVIAYKPKLLILDEPTAGLDARSKREIMELFKTINKEGIDILLITHDMELANDYASKIIVMDNGEIKRIGAPKEIFKEDVEQYNLESPFIYKTINLLKEKGINVDSNKVNDINSLIEEIKRHG